jgi:hypothetical protein
VLEVLKMRKKLRPVFLLTILFSTLFSPALVFPSAAEPFTTSMHKKVDIFNGVFTPSDVTVEPNEKFDISFTICPTMDVPATFIRFIMPADLVRLENSEDVWTGDVEEGERLTLNLSFVTNGEIEAYVRADVEADQSGVIYRNSYYLHVVTTTTRIEETVPSTREINPEIEITEVTEPESPRTIESTEQGTSMDPQSPGTIRIRGRFVYLNEDGGYSPARYMLVWLRDDDTGTDEWVAYQWTNANGDYDFTVENDDGFLQDGRDPYVQLWAEGAWDWITTTSGGSKYGWSTAKCGNDVPDGFYYNYGTLVPTSGNEALQAGDAVYAESQWQYDRVTWYRPTKVTIRWPRESWPHCHGDYIDLPAKSTWAWDHVTVQHEYAHSVMYTLYGNSFPPGSGPSPHYIFSESSLGFAYVEGWAEFMQCAVDNDPNNLADWYGGHGGNIETNDWFNCIDTGDMDGYMVEGSVASILWDINDPTSTSDRDYMYWGFNEIFYVLKNDKPMHMSDFWFDWIIHWNTLSTSIGPLSTIYWHYGIDRDYYAPHNPYISINSGATYTTSSTVTLSLSCSDWGSGVTHMRFRNSASDPWTGLYTYATSKSWTLSSGDGLKYVYAQYKDGKNYYSSVVYDTIIKDTVNPTGSISINSGDPVTTSTSVTLYLTYYDATSGVYKVRYANEGQSWTAWESPSSTKAWTLTSGDGTKKVYYQIIDKAGRLSSTYSDTIILDTKPKFDYHFRMSPLTNVVHMDVDKKGWINGYMDGGPTGWNPVLGKVVGDRAFIAIDMHPDGSPAPYEMWFLAGTVSKLKGKLIRTVDGMSYNGPIDVTIVPIAGPELKGVADTEDSSSEVSMDAWYKLRINPFVDIIHLNINPGWWLNGYDEPNHPVLGFVEGDKWYFAVDGLGTSYTLIFNTGSLSTLQGQMIRTADGNTFIGPTNIWLTEVASPESVEGDSALKP